MKTRLIVIIVIQFILIICLSIFSLLKIVEVHKHSELEEQHKERTYTQEILLRQQIEINKKQLRECQENK